MKQQRELRLTREPEVSEYLPSRSVIKSNYCYIFNEKIKNSLHYVGVFTLFWKYSVCSMCMWAIFSLLMNIDRALY